MYWRPNFDFDIRLIQNQIDPGADDLELVNVTQGQLRLWHDVIECLQFERNQLRKLLREGLKQGDFSSPHWWGDEVRRVINQ